MNDVPIEDLISLAIAFSSLITAVATVLIAWVAYRFSKAQVRQDRDASVRQSLSDWNSQIDLQIPQTESAQFAALSTARNIPALDQLKSLNVDTRRLESMLDILRGHLWWLQQVHNPEDHWINEFDNMDVGDGESISAMINGVLDVVKDEVLVSNQGVIDDLTWILKTFWTEAYFEESETDSLQKILKMESVLEKQVELAVAKWVRHDATTDALIRITALTRYRLRIELSFRTFFVGTFTSPNYGVTTSTSKKFRDGMRSATSQIRSDIDKEFEKLLFELK